MANSLTLKSPGIYRGKKGRIATNITARNRSKGNKNPKRKKKKQVRGKEVAIRQNLAPAEILYGRMKTGGIYTFIETNSNSKASLTVGSGNKQIAFIAKTAGASGNNITVEVVVPVSQPSIVITVTGNRIQITNKSNSGGSPTGSANEIITAIRASGPADALVDVHRGEGTGDGNVDPFAETFLSGGGGTGLHQIITLAGHEIDAVEALYLDNRQVTFGASPDSRWATGAFSNRCFMAINYGSDSQEAQPDLIGQLPTKWTTNHRQRGCAHAYIILVWNANTFAEGLPEISFTVRGKKCYDPRTATIGWTQNAALIIGDYLMDTRIGLGVPLAQIDNTTWQAAAAVCDEAVSLADGGTEPRYTINGVFDADMDPEQVLEQMAQAMGGDIVFQGGKWYIYPAKYYSPAVTLNEDDVVGELRISTRVGRSDLFNSVRGTYVSPGDNYNERDFPAVKNSTYITEDQGVQIWEDLSLDFVTSVTQCQRLAKIELERVRQGIQLVWPCSAKGLQLGVCDTVNVTLAKYGWSNKVFEVRDIQLGIDPAKGIVVDLLLRETAAGVFDWNSGEETDSDLSPNTNLPDPFNVGAPGALVLSSGTSELYMRADGTIFSRLKVAWPASSDQFVRNGGLHEVEYKQSAVSTWSPAGTVGGDATFMHILDVQDTVSYDVRVRAVNVLGVESDWTVATNHIVIGKTAPPSNVTSFSATASDLGIQLSWTGITDLDRSEYEIRLGLTWSSGIPVARLRAEVTAYVWPQLLALTYRLMIKAIDTSGNYSTNEAVALVTILPPNPVDGLVARSIGNTVLIDWQDSPVTTLSVNQFEVYKGPTLESAVRIAVAFGTFITYLEPNGGTFTYWIIAVDVGGNSSSEVSIELTVQPQSNFYVVSDINPFAVGTEVDKAYCVVGGSADAPDEPDGDLYFPVGRRVVGTSEWSPPGWEDDVETFEEWFDNNGFSTFQDFIDSGYGVPLAPNPHWPGYVEYKYDFGVLLPNTFINFTWTTEIYGEALISILPTISVSADDVSYTDSQTAQLFADNFRYVKFRLDFHGYDDKVFARLTGCRALLNVQEDEELGESAVFEADSGGTTINLTRSFLYVTNIQLTAAGTSMRTPVYDFAGGQNPTSFKILLFDVDGNRVDGTVAWRVRGPLNP